MDKNKILELAREAWNERGFTPTWIADQLERFAALIEREVRGDAEPDWRHPKIQALIAADARNRIVIDLIWKLIDNPECEMTASDMEYWDSIHEALLDKLIHPAPAVGAKPVAWLIKQEIPTEDCLVRHTRVSAIVGDYNRAEAHCGIGKPIPLYTHPAPAVVRQLVGAVERLREKAKWINDEQAIVGYGELMEVKEALAAAEIGKQMGGSDD